MKTRKNLIPLLLLMTPIYLVIIVGYFIIIGITEFSDFIPLVFLLVITMTLIFLRLKIAVWLKKQNNIQKLINYEYKIYQNVYLRYRSEVVGKGKTYNRFTSDLAITKPFVPKIFKNEETLNGIHLTIMQLVKERPDLVKLYFGRDLFNFNDFKLLINDFKTTELDLLNASTLNNTEATALISESQSLNSKNFNNQSADFISSKHIITEDINFLSDLNNIANGYLFKKLVDIEFIELINRTQVSNKIERIGQLNQVCYFVHEIHKIIRSTKDDEIANLWRDSLLSVLGIKKDRYNDNYSNCNKAIDSINEEFKGKVNELSIKYTII